MQKYWHVIKIGLANTLVYRFNFFCRAAFSLIPLLATIYLWRTIYRGQTGAVAGYSLAGMISYYLMVTIVDTLTAVTEDDWQIAGRHQGRQHQPVPAQTDQLPGLPPVPVFFGKIDFHRPCRSCRSGFSYFAGAIILSGRMAGWPWGAFCWPLF